ncbi:MAG TPA: hypothetical protein VMR45_02225 [Patescibacteria group bacterium]|nr:hypothetical protein [Patescibacteria group bacterium]
MQANVTEGAAVDNLLASVAEQLKVPLTVIARHAELTQLTGRVDQSDMTNFRVQAESALQLVDSYLLGLQLMRDQAQLELEPVSVSSVLVDTAHSLGRYARQHHVEIELDIAGKYRPVMANAKGLRAALLSLGYGMVEAQAAHQNPSLRKLVLATHRTPGGIIAGIYSTANYDLNAEQWRKALQLCGSAPQPFGQLGAGSSAGIFVADAIFRSMTTCLRVGRYAHQQGLAATLHPSQQLQFV